jgi:isopentenyl diphosphate isomerase/L-lactate dehydrogenase-like FMN-dependent dehydrogenase
MSYADFQNEVYLNGLFGQQPTQPFGWRETEAAAYEAMTPGAVGYVAGGAGGEDTMRANREAFDRWRLVPRMLRGIPAKRTHETTVLGTTMAAPVMLAPVGVLEIVHPEAELAVARAAAAAGVTMVVSTASSNTMEDIAAQAPDASRWYQLYWPADRDLAASFVRRAEAARYEAVVVTLDTWQLGWRPRDLSTAYLPFLKAQGVANYFADPVFREGLEKTPEEDQGPAVLKFLGLFNNPTLTWDDIAFLRDHTSLPLVLKGIQHPDDVRKAREIGVQGIVCSNHGGRQVDGAIGSLDALPALVEAAGDLPVLFDSGVRTGADACKALALGAAAVLLGRPFVHGLALGGEQGVHHVLRSFLADMDLQAGLAGHSSVSELSPESLQRV